MQISAKVCLCLVLFIINNEYTGPEEALHNWSGQNLSLSTIQLNVWAVDNFTTADILVLSVILQCYKSNRCKNYKITLPFCLLLSFLHNRIPCRHNAWAANNLAPLDMVFLSIITEYNKCNKSKNHTSTFVYYLHFVEMESNFYLEKNWSGQNQKPDHFRWP